MMPVLRHHQLPKINPALYQSNGTMQPLILAVLASLIQAIQASQTVFSVHDDVLAFPQ
ncbi:unnamed protein product, partial [Diplocarpon coronariae]